jgi:hypothetical protein
MQLDARDIKESRLIEDDIKFINLRERTVKTEGLTKS